MKITKIAEFTNEEKKKYEAPDIGMCGLVCRDIMKISTQEGSEDDGNWGGFIPFKKSRSSSGDWQDGNW